LSIKDDLDLRQVRVQALTPLQIEDFLHLHAPDHAVAAAAARPDGMGGNGGPGGEHGGRSRCLRARSCAGQPGTGQIGGSVDDVHSLVFLVFAPGSKGDMDSRQAMEIRFG